MKKRKLLALGMVAMMGLTSITGCGVKTTDDTTTASGTTASGSGDTAAPATTTASSVDMKGEGEAEIDVLLYMQEHEKAI